MRLSDWIWGVAVVAVLEFAVIPLMQRAKRRLRGFAPRVGLDFSGDQTRFAGRWGR